MKVFLDLKQHVTDDQEQIHCFETNFDILLQFCVLLRHTNVDFCSSNIKSKLKIFLGGNQAFYQLQNAIKPSIFIHFFQPKFKKNVPRTTHIILHEVKNKSPSDRKTSFQIRFSQLISREFQDLSAISFFSDNTTFHLDLSKDTI